MKRHKYCYKCDALKLLSDFNGHCETKDGKQTSCRKCQNTNDLRRYYERKDNMFAREIV